MEGRRKSGHRQTVYGGRPTDAAVAFCQGMRYNKTMDYIANCRLGMIYWGELFT
jgi:hypothetical protein